MQINPRLGSTQRLRRLVLAVMVLSLLPLLLVSASVWDDGSLWDEGIETIGVLLTLLCILGRAACTLYIGGRKCEELVSVGPYSVSRNPLYFFSLLGTVGVGLLFGSLVLGAVFGVTYFLVFDRLIRREEQFLASRFPAAFPAYCAVTPRWHPRPKLWRGVDEILVKPKLVFRTLRDSSVFLLMLPLFELVEWLQQVRVLPILFRLP